MKGRYLNTAKAVRSMLDVGCVLVGRRSTSVRGHVSVAWYVLDAQEVEYQVAPMVVTRMLELKEIVEVSHAHIRVYQRPRSPG